MSYGRSASPARQLFFGLDFGRFFDDAFAAIKTVGSDAVTQMGLTRLRIGGQGATLKDMVNRFFTVRYRATNETVAVVVGTNWSEYTAFNLAEGWVERVLNELTPFEQRMRDLYNNPAETQASMIAQAGRPYVGDVALNMESVSSAGLIPGKCTATIFRSTSASGKRM